MANLWIFVLSIPYIVHHVYTSPWTVTFLVAFTVDGGVSIFDWQVYCPPWDVCRGLNERVRVLVEWVVLWVPTVMPLPLVTSEPLLEYSHWTVGGTLASTVQVKLSVSPDIGTPEVMMVTLCSNSVENRSRRCFIEAMTTTFWKQKKDY